MNLSVICRTCLTDVKKEPIGLTEQLFNIIENDLRLREVPRSHPQIDLPANICLSCYRLLVHFERFYAKCRSAEKFLKSKINAIQDIQAKDQNQLVDYYHEDEELPDIEILRDDHTELDTIVIEYETVGENEIQCQKPHNSKVDIKEPQPYNSDDDNEDNFMYLDESIETDALVELQDNEEPAKKEAKLSVLYVCKVCQMEFNSRGDLSKHEMTHPGLRPFVCKVCGAGFKDRTAINYHMTTHNGKLFPCTLCEKKCATRSMLRSHVRYSHGCHNFQCDQCGEIFKTGHLLSCHKTKHNGTQQYVCKFCTSAYFNRHDLLNHVKHIHIYYNCNICSTTYKKFIKIRNHLKSKHDIIENAEEHFTKKYGS